MGPLVRLLNRHNRHLEGILGVLERGPCIIRHRGGPTAPTGPAAPINRRTRQNRPKEPTYNRHRSRDQEHLRREVVDHRAGRT
jgi:hypothetical protein